METNCCKYIHALLLFSVRMDKEPPFCVTLDTLALFGISIIWILQYLKLYYYCLSLLFKNATQLNGATNFTISNPFKFS